MRRDPNLSEIVALHYQEIRANPLLKEGSVRTANEMAVSGGTALLRCRPLDCRCYAASDSLSILFPPKTIREPT